MEGDYDDLDPASQAERRARWEETFDEMIDGLDLAAEFEEAGIVYSELDPEGNVITHNPRA